MPIFSNQAGINLTVSKLQLIEMSWDEENIILENADEEFLSGYIDKNTPEKELVSLIQEAYNQIIIRHPVNAKSVSFTLPTQLFEITELPIDDLLTKEDLSSHLNWEYSVMFPHKNADDFLLRYFETGNSEFQGVKKILTAAIEKRILKAVHKFCAANNLSLRFVDNVHFAANLLIRRNSTPSAYLSVYSDDDFFSFMIFEEGHPRYFKSFDEADLNLAAEKIKNEFSSFYSGQKEISEMKDIYVSGESFTESGISVFASRLNAGIQKIAPFSKLATSPRLFRKDLIGKKFHSFAGPIGIAARIS